MGKLKKKHHLNLFSLNNPVISIKMKRSITAL